MIISISIGSTSATARIINNNDAANYEDNNYSAMTAATRQRRLGLGEEVFFDEMLEEGSVSFSSIQSLRSSTAASRLAMRPGSEHE